MNTLAIIASIQKNTLEEEQRNIREKGREVELAG